MSLSKLVYGTASGYSDAKDDFRLYNSLKAAVLTGGVNRIDTGHTFRRFRSERIVGLVLRTLINKYQVSRDELYIQSKQGFVGRDVVSEVNTSLIIEELV